MQAPIVASELALLSLLGQGPTPEVAEQAFRVLVRGHNLSEQEAREGYQQWFNELNPDEQRYVDEQIKGGARYVEAMHRLHSSRGGA